jgi:hypothetical protein
MTTRLHFWQLGLTTKLHVEFSGICWQVAELLDKVDGSGHQNEIPHRKKGKAELLSQKQASPL